MHGLMQAAAQQPPPTEEEKAAAEAAAVAAARPRGEPTAPLERVATAELALPERMDALMREHLRFLYREGGPSLLLTQSLKMLVGSILHIGLSTWHTNHVQVADCSLSYPFSIWMI